MRKIIGLIFTSAVVVNAIATPYVADVSAQQRFPWNGLVDVKYEIVGSTNGIKWAYGTLKATDRDSGRVYTARTFVKPLDLSEGKHHAIWDMSADVEAVSTNVVFSVSIEKPSLYIVVDLSGGADATSYPVSDLHEAPSSGWTEPYKTTKLVLRLIEPGSDATIAKPYYMGVFEVTQKQYELVTGYKPSSFNGDALPVEQVSWNAIRGNASRCNWPTVKEVHADSFVGRLQARTGLEFDLPTCAQWEFACRAGTTTVFSYGDSENGDYMWYSSNAGGKTHEVGTKLPNAWGLFDMHGNVWEWSLDSSGSYRVLRGGRWDSGGGYCTSSYRYGNGPSYVNYFYGFRLVRTLSK